MNRRSSVSERRARPGAAFAAVAGLLFAACGGSRPERPNIVLISIDSLRADHVGAYGYGRDTTPNIDALAAESVLFENAVSTTTWTLPAHVSMLSGFYPPQHGVQLPKHEISPNVPLLSELLSAVGYRSAAAVSGIYLASRYGYARGWEIYDDSVLRESAPIREVSSARLHRTAIQLLDRLQADPFFLFLHYYDVHHDYVPPPPYDTLFDAAYRGNISRQAFERNPEVHAAMAPRELAHFVALYDGEIRWVDTWIGEFLKELRTRGLIDSTLIVLTADHGDEFFEHGAKGHGKNLYNTTLRIPLIVRFPGGTHGGRKIHSNVSLVDLVPTIASVARIDHDDRWPGADLSMRLLGSLMEPGPRSLFFSLGDRFYGMIRRNEKLITVFSDNALDPSQVLLVDLQEDPAELINLATSERRRAARNFVELQKATRTLLLRLDRARPGHVAADDELDAQLRALGYL